uniref:subtilisin n=1 Tax=Globisporangium ultimum (strain ATCC 200006 / CBS 805.95 / DAOM BR144) TaxID=431595 RepID=K3WWR2_GLOUD
MNIRSAVLFATAAIAALSFNTNVEARPRVEPSVHRTLRQEGSVNLMITMKASTRRALQSVNEKAFATRGDKIQHLVETLEAHASSTGRDVEKLLSQESSSEQPLFTSYQKFWITNQIYIESASWELLEKLVTLDSIEEVREEEVVQLEDSDSSSSSGSADAGSAGVAWGVEQIGAPLLWVKGFTGQGVVVGSIDSGVHYTHENLAGNFVGDYGWYAPPNNLTAPSDKSGHGTHVMGTIAGSGGIGVAPGAKWMTCRGCPSGLCVENYLLTCFQFITCPTDPEGKNRDCSKAPHVVNNSWSSPAGKKTYVAAIDAWLAAGIIPVFASGNTGPTCTTTRSPGDYPTVISVGSLAVNGTLARSSSKGPALDSSLVKPDLSAPGVLVRSAAFDSDSGYTLKSGTSMATPHVVGAIALLLSAKPDLTFNEVRDLLRVSTVKAGLTPLNSSCGSLDDATWPNNNYGHGRVNVYGAYEKLVAGSSSSTL